MHSVATKRQHFVPCVYLKWFAQDGDEKGRDSTIYAFNANTMLKTTPNNSGFQNEFYAPRTEADEIEAQLGRYEEEYDLALRALLNAESITWGQKFFLFTFCILTSCRNASISISTDTDRQDSVRDGYWSMLRNFLDVDDITNCGHERRLEQFKSRWEVEIIETGPRGLITSDNPVSYWRFPGQEDISLIYMPITPLAALFVYDRRHIQIAAERLSPSDVARLNGSIYGQRIHFGYAHDPSAKDMEGDLVSQIDDEHRGHYGDGSMGYTVVVHEPTLDLIIRQ